jgi:hypothetical protein
MLTNAQARPRRSVPGLRQRTLAIALMAAGLTFAGCGGDPEDVELQATAAAPLGLHRPASVPAEYVVTPAGYFHPSCVLRSRPLIASGDPSATPVSQAHAADACAYVHYDRRGRVMDRSFADLGHVPFTGGNWITNANAVVSGVSASTNVAIYAKVKVPPAPSHQGGQTIYIFDGLEPSASGNDIMQPVLGWSGGRWSMQNWNCCMDGNAWNDGDVTVHPGDVISQYVKGKTSSSFVIGWKNNDTGGREFHVDARGEIFDWAFGGVLEAYDIGSCSQYPAGGKISFTNLVVKRNGQAQSLGWNHDGSQLSPDCNPRATSGASSVTLRYHN